MVRSYYPKQLRLRQDSKLGKSVIIFICPFDRFEYGFHFYSFSERCDQNPNIKLNHNATKIFLSTKGTVDDVSPDILAFLNYVDSGIVLGKFVEELDVAVNTVKSNEKARHDFMIFQMYLLEQEMEAEDRRAEEIAVKLIRMGLSSSDISEATDLPIFSARSIYKTNFFLQ